MMRHLRSRDCGDFWGKRGPVDGVRPIRAISTLDPGSAQDPPVETERHAFAYVFEGDGTFSEASQPLGVLTEKAGEGGETLVRERTGNRSLVLFDSGSEVTVQAGRRHRVACCSPASRSKSRSLGTGRS